jgi:hypothetical protein
MRSRAHYHPIVVIVSLSSFCRCVFESTTGWQPANGEKQRSLACYQLMLHPEAKDGLRLRNPAHDHEVT